MISRQYKCIFVHVPKCASTSILRAFDLKWTHPDAIFMSGGVQDEKILDLPPFFRFSCVRNPFDRFISGWKYCGFTKRRLLIEMVKNLPHMHPIPDDTQDPNTEYFAHFHITATQRSRLFRPDGSPGMDFLMRYESLQDDFDHVCDLIGKPRVVLPRENTTERAPYQEYFDPCPEAREIVEQHFREDLETFGYHY